jgi:hypothetical protein
MRNTLFIKSVRNTLVLIIAAFFLSCGIFTPRQSEPPTPPERPDPLNFSTIMPVGYQFTKLDYEDLFNENLIYFDINSSSSNKAQLIQKLQLIQRQNATISVQWTAGNVIPKPNDTFYLNGLQYKVFLTGNTAATPDDSGSSDFVVVESNSDWQICSWRDYPKSQGRSFFSPP